MGKERGSGRVPRSSREFNSVILDGKNGERVASETSDGDHRTFKIIGRTPEEPSDTLTIIQGCRDLKDSNPKVWHKLVKKLKSLGLLSLVIVGAGAGLAIAERLMTSAYAQGIESGE